jgi:hypothetical protein
MSRREWVACLGASLGLLAAHRAPAWLASSSGWPALAAGEPAIANYVTWLLVLPLPVVGAILAGALLTFAEVHGVAGPQRRRRRPLPRYPFDSSKTQLVIGETHRQDGSRSEQPGWLVLPEKIHRALNRRPTGAEGAAEGVGSPRTLPVGVGGNPSELGPLFSRAGHARHCRDFPRRRHLARGGGPGGLFPGQAG